MPKIMFGTRIFSLLKSPRIFLQCLGSRSVMSDRVLKISQHIHLSEIAREKIRGKEAAFWRKMDGVKNVLQISVEDYSIASTIANQEQVLMVFDLINRYARRLDHQYQRTSRRRYHLLSANLVRQCYCLGAIDQAREMFAHDPIPIAFCMKRVLVVYCDMLFETQSYQELVSAVEKFVDVMPQNSGLGSFECLYYLALYKIGTPEAFEKADNFWNKYRREITSLRRSNLVYAAMQLKKSDPQKAIDVITGYCGSTEYYLTANIYIQALLAVGNWQHALQVYSQLRGVSLLLDTLEDIQKSGKMKEFNKWKNSFVKRVTLEDEVCSPIEDSEPWDYDPSRYQSARGRRVKNHASNNAANLENLDRKIALLLTEVNECEENETKDNS